jgi:hypothetical protein
MVRARYIEMHLPELLEPDLLRPDLLGPDLLDADWDGYRIGSESCHHLLPGLEQINELSESLDPEKLSLITAIAGPGQDTNVLKTAETALNAGWGEVVVNDWGILEQVSKLGTSRITAGRLLMRFRRGPGEVDRWDELDETSRKYFAWGPLYDSAFLGFLREMGVVRLELDPPRHWLPLPETDGFALSLHLEERFVTLSAACPWLYDEEKGSWKPDEACSHQCRTGEDISMTNAKLDQPLILRDKATLEKVQQAVDLESLPANVDRIIYRNQP